MQLARIDLTERFKKDFKKLPPEVARRVQDIIRDDLMPWPSKKSLRHHSLSGHKPTVHSIDVLPNKSYKMTFEISGDAARLLRVATHREIDREPR